MDVRAGLKKHHASDAGAVARDKTFKGQRDAKKKAYAAGEAARAGGVAADGARGPSAVEEEDPAVDPPPDLRHWSAAARGNEPPQLPPQHQQAPGNVPR